MNIKEDFEKYYGKDVRLSCTDEIIIEGHVTGFVTALDSDRGLQELDIKANNGICYNIAEDEINRIEII